MAPAGPAMRAGRTTRCQLERSTLPDVADRHAWLAGTAGNDASEHRVKRLHPYRSNLAPPHEIRCHPVAEVAGMSDALRDGHADGVILERGKSLLIEDAAMVLEVATHRLLPGSRRTSLDTVRTRGGPLAVLMASIKSSGRGAGRSWRAC